MNPKFNSPIQIMKRSNELTLKKKRFGSNFYLRHDMENAYNFSWVSKLLKRYKKAHILDLPTHLSSVRMKFTWM